MARGLVLLTRLPPHAAAPNEEGVLCAAMADGPIAELPEEINLTRDEVAVVLFALDMVETAGLQVAEAGQVRRAVRLLTAKLWPELGELLEDDDG